jgi:hypothetical protein
MKKPFPPRSSRSGSDGLRIAQEIATIQAALRKHGYRIRKQPKQAAWKIFTPPPNSPPLARGTGRVRDTPPLARKAGGVREEYYLLTYQPAPINAWVLHPQTNDTHRHAIETLIQRTLKQQPANLRRKVNS